MKRVLLIVILALTAWIISPTPTAQGELLVQGQSEHYLSSHDTIGNDDYDWYYLNVQYHEGFGPMYPGSIAVTGLGMTLHQCSEYESDTRMHVDWLVLRNQFGDIKHEHWDWNDHKCTWWDEDIPGSGVVINSASCAKASARTDPKINNAGDHPDQNAVVYICNINGKVSLNKKLPVGAHYG